MSDPTPEPDDSELDPRLAGPEPTGDPEIDAALADLDGLVDRPVNEHHDQLARAHETLHAALDRGEPTP